MKIRIQIYKTNRGYTCSPLDNEVLFTHCSGGLLSVSLEQFETGVEPLLKLHGVERVDRETVVKID